VASAPVDADGVRASAAGPAAAAAAADGASAASAASSATAAPAPAAAEAGGADGAPAADADEDAQVEAMFRAKREKKRQQQEQKRKLQEEAKARAAREAAEAASAQAAKDEQARAEADEAAEKERMAKTHRERKFELQQEEAKRREREKTERARKEQQALKSPEDPRDAAVPGELDELELERQAFERAERAVRDEDARQEAMKFAAEEAAAAEELSRQALERARVEAQRLFNEQDLKRRRRGTPEGVVTTKTYPEPPLRCALCHVVVIGARGRTGRAVIEKLLSLGESVMAVARAEIPGVVSVPRWFAELMAKARFRGINLEWDVADVTDPDSLDRVFAGAKAVVFAVTATPSSDAGQARQVKDNSAEAVDNLGLGNVARKAGEHAVERLIVISQAGVTRPVVSSLSKALWGTWGDVGKAMHWNLLKHKRLGELAAIRECRETRGETTYTIVRATNLGNSTYEGSWGVAPESIKTLVGDNVDVSAASTTRAQVAALAVEAIFTEAAINRVVEVVARGAEDMQEAQEPEKLDSKKQEPKMQEPLKHKSNTGSSSGVANKQAGSGEDKSKHGRQDKPKEEAGKDAGKDEEKKEVCTCCVRVRAGALCGFGAGLWVLYCCVDVQDLMGRLEARSHGVAWGNRAAAAVTMR